MKNFLKQWLNFDDMITPRIITVVYWLLLAASVISGILGTFANPVLGIIGTIFGLIGLRVSFELIILFFKIYAQVKRIADNLDDKSGTANTD